MSLTLFAPEIQEVILAWPAITEGRDPFTERTLRAIAAVPNWTRQLTLWSTAFHTA